MKTVVVTGGAGFIGANLVPRLLAEGYDVAVFDNLSRGKVEHVPRQAQLIEGDIRDERRLLAALQGRDAVVHLAAFGSVMESMSDPWANFEVNVRGTLSVLEAARRAGVARVLFASTGGALIGEAEPPVDEQSLPKPISPYGAGKLAGEAYCHAYSHFSGLAAVALRFANVYGPFSMHKKGAVTRFIKCILRGEPITIYGDGSASRDFLFAADLCDGIARALTTDLRGGEVFHLASGVETTVLELAHSLFHISGHADHPVKMLPRRQGEVTRNFARFDKAQEVLGFSPSWPLERGLRETWHWFSERREALGDAVETDS